MVNDTSIWYCVFLRPFSGNPTHKKRKREHTTKVTTPRMAMPTYVPPLPNVPPIPVGRLLVGAPAGLTAAPAVAYNQVMELPSREYEACMAGAAWVQWENDLGQRDYPLHLSDAFVEHLHPDPMCLCREDGCRLASSFAPGPYSIDLYHVEGTPSASTACPGTMSPNGVSVHCADNSLETTAQISNVASDTSSRPSRKGCSRSRRRSKGIKSRNHPLESTTILQVHTKRNHTHNKCAHHAKICSHHKFD